jgi:hypothetical protein
LREHQVHELARLIRDVDEQLSSIVRMRPAAHQPAPFQRVQQ